MIRILLTLCMIFIGIRTAGAESWRFSLKDAIRTAVEKNGRVRAAGYSAEAARQDIAVVSSRYYPSLTFEESFNISNSPTQTFMMKLDEGRFTQNDFLINNLNSPSSQHDFRTALLVRLPLYNPSVSPAREIAVKEFEIQGTRLERSKEDTAFKVFKLYLAAQKGQARLQTAEQSLGEAREHLRIAGVRSQAGVGLRSDELRARTYLSLMEQQLISARNNLVIARMELANETGLTAGDSIEISETNISAPPLFSSDEELVDAALINASDLKQSHSEHEKAEAVVRLARSSYLPSVNAVASYQMNSANTPFGNDNDSWNAGVALSWQLFDGFKRCRERDRAVAVKSAAAELLEYSRRETVLRINESYLRSEEMGMRREVAGNSLEDAEETVRLLEKRFENSLATMVELLDAQTALIQSRADLVDSEAGFALARGFVFYTAGIFFKEMTK